MKVFKFGGASVSTVERIKNVGFILKKYENEKLLVVISAMGKTTNALEKVVNAFYEKDKSSALSLFEDIKKTHLNIAFDLTGEPIQALQDFFTEIEWLLHDNPVKPYDYYYDQIVCIGEMLSSTIVSNYLNSAGVNNEWIDVRDIIRTDDTFRDAKIDWEITSEKMNTQVVPLFKSVDVVITQGFIGATDENESTTLGREGSDYTAAVFANILNADCVSIWKDVQGVMNADPKIYKNAQWIKELNYKEVIEMAYYGAQVIHPKTIKPLQNKHIPMYVRSFVHPDEEGTYIHNGSLNNLPPIIVYKENQVLVQLNSKDFSFVSDQLTTDLYTLFGRLKIKPNLTQNAAISFLCVLDDHPNKIEEFALTASELFDVQVNSGLTLLTIRHFTQDLLADLTREKTILLSQQTPETIQVLIK
jgi:aspartate kinase